MIKIAYLTSEQVEMYAGKPYSEFGIFTPIEDDLTGQFYITSYEIENLNLADFFWLLDLEMVDVPDHEKYKFKL